MDVCLLCNLSSVFTEATWYPFFLHCLGCTCLLFRLSLSAAVARLSYAVLKRAGTVFIYIARIGMMERYFGEKGQPEFRRQHAEDLVINDRIRLYE